MKFTLTVALAVALALASPAAPAAAGLITDTLGVTGCAATAAHAATLCKPDALARR